jgi:hypothetical protein
MATKQKDDSSAWVVKRDAGERLACVQWKLITWDRFQFYISFVLKHDTNDVTTLSVQKHKDYLTKSRLNSYGNTQYKKGDKVNVLDTIHTRQFTGLCFQVFGGEKMNFWTKERRDVNDESSRRYMKLNCVESKTRLVCVCVCCMRKGTGTQSPLFFLSPLAAWRSHLAVDFQARNDNWFFKKVFPYLIMRVLLILLF